MCCSLHQGCSKSFLDAASLSPLTHPKASTPLPLVQTERLRGQRYSDLSRGRAAAESLVGAWCERPFLATSDSRQPVDPARKV